MAFRAARGKEKNISLFGAGILGGVIVCGLLTFPSFTLPPSVAGERHVAAALVPEAHDPSRQK